MPERKSRPVKVALIGAGGMLAQAVKRTLPEHWPVFGFDLPEFDLCNRQQVLQICSELRPELIINCAAYTQVDRCESEEDLATRVNGDGPGFLALAAKALDCPLVHISTDYVFAGDGEKPYSETDILSPLSAYGRSKLKGEQAIVDSGLSRYYIVRTSWLYGPGGPNFVETVLRLAAERDELRIVADQVGSPTFTYDLAQAIVNLVGSSPATSPGAAYGIYHFSDSGSCSWFDFADEIVRQAKDIGVDLKCDRVVPIATEDYPLPAPRPKFSVFAKNKYRQATGAVEPDWKQSLSTYLSIRTTQQKEQK